jgi:hypothetical protein
MPGQIQVQNLAELRSAIRFVAGAGGTKALRTAGIQSSSLVAVEARHEVVKRTSRLERSILPGATATVAYVKAGTAKSVPYAGVQNYGWPGPAMSRKLARSKSPYWRNVGRKGVRGVAATHFLDDAALKETPAVFAVYERAIRALCAAIGKS